MHQGLGREWCRTCNGSGRIDLRYEQRREAGRVEARRVYAKMGLTGEALEVLVKQCCPDG